jgi:hypothetical protein
VSAVWVVRDAGGDVEAAFPREGKAIDYIHRHWDDGLTVTRETLLTPAQSAVLEAATVYCDNRTVANEHDLIDAVATLREQEGA